MKQFFLISTMLMLFSFIGLAQTKKIESVYTDLTEKNCKKLKPDPAKGILYRGQCPGVGGYKLIFLESDLRQSLDLIAPGGKEFELDFWSKVAAPQIFLFRQNSRMARCQRRCEDKTDCLNRAV